MTIPKKWATTKTELDLKTDKALVLALEKEAKATGEAKVLAGANAVKQKFGNYEALVAKNKTAEAVTMAKIVVTLFNATVEAVTKAVEEEDDKGGKAVYTVKGSMPTAKSMDGASAAVDKAKKIYSSMKSGKDPHEAAKAAGVNERPTIIVRKKNEHWVYEFRLSHGSTQYRLNAEAKSKDEGKNIEVEFKYLGPGH